MVLKKNSGGVKVRVRLTVRLWVLLRVTMTNYATVRVFGTVKVGLKVKEKMAASSPPFNRHAGYNQGWG